MNKIEFLHNLDKYNKEDHSTFLEHYGILGQKWGQRRWQNADGTFNEAGKERYFGTGKYQKVGTEDKVGKNNNGGIRYRPSSRGKWFHLDYQNNDGSLTKKGQKLLKRYTKHPKFWNINNIIDTDMLDEYNKKKADELRNKELSEEAKNKAKEEAEQKKIREEQERISSIKNEVKITKELAGENITDNEFKDIVKELDNFDMRDFERNHKEDYNKVADIGIDALNKAEGYADAEIGNDNDREWFMWEDQTIGNPELAYLYYKGYSKDYIKQYLDKYIPYEDKGKYSDNEYSKGFFVKYEFHRGGNDYVDALFDKGEEDQKIGSNSEKNRNKFAQEYLSRKNISNGHKMFDQMIEDDPEFKKLTDEHWEKEKKFRDDAVKKGSINSFEHVKILNDYYDKIADLAEKKYGLNGNEKYDFAFHTQGISEEKIHDDSKFKDISKLPVNDTAEDIKEYQEYAKQRREEKIGSAKSKFDKSWENRMEDYTNKLQKAKNYKEMDKIEEDLLNDKEIKKHYDKIKKIYEKTRDWNKVDEYIIKVPAIQKQDWIYDIVENHAKKEVNRNKNNNQKIGSALSDYRKAKEEPKQLEDHNKLTDWLMNKETSDKLKNINKSLKSSQNDPWKYGYGLKGKKWNNSQANNWDYVNDAIAKLGLGSKEKLSQADWDKINKEVLKLKK